MVTSDFRPEVEIQPSRSCAMHPAIIIGTVRSLWTFLWGRYHVPQNVFLVMYKHSAEIRRQNTDRLTCEWTIPKLKFRSLIVFMCTCAQRYSIVHCKKRCCYEYAYQATYQGCWSFALTLRLRPTQGQCHVNVTVLSSHGSMLTSLIPICFYCVNSMNCFLKSIFCVTASSAPVEHDFLP